ncbi:putative ribonuclease H-like domain-containing protein [Tanacetum coccineum]|uniref:Ribonuclease H-like domain-containing protein n=1 Tax=Tanacetum coccineum TaxID=301880 RepID=A0ABQ5IFE5_9ASTR
MVIPEASANLRLLLIDASVIVYSIVSIVACNSRVRSARVLAVAVCQNYLTKESWIIGLLVKAYLRLEPLRKSTISANPALSSGSDVDRELLGLGTSEVLDADKKKIEYTLCKDKEDFYFDKREILLERKLEEIAQNHLGTVPENKSTSTLLVNSGSEPVNTGELDPDDLAMPELKIFHKSETRIFDEASYDEEGVVTDFNSLPTKQSAAKIRSSCTYQLSSKAAKKQSQRSTTLFKPCQEDVVYSFKLATGMGSCRSTSRNEEVIVVKALYGLHQAPRAWYATLSTFLEKHGYKRGTIDKTLFIKRDKKDIMLVQVYVDDIIFGSTKKSWCDEFEALMKSKFQISSMGELIFFLGLQVKQNKEGIFISQDKYVAEILKKFNLVSVKTAITPMETKVALTKDEEAVDVDVHLYRSMIESLSTLRANPFDLKAFSDSDYDGSNLDRKSTTGGCQYLGQRLISWQCKKQTIVATSKTKAEYVATTNCYGQVLWVQNQLLDYGFNFMNTKIHIDNESTICIVKNLVYHSKTKHIEIRYHFIRDCYEKKLISVEKIHTYLNVADLLTKPFDGPQFNFLVASIGMINP